MNFCVESKEVIEGVQRPRPGFGYGYYHRYYGVWTDYETDIRQFTEGALHIDVIDTARKTLVWEAVAHQRLQNDDFTFEQEDVRLAVQRVFDNMQKQAVEVGKQIVELERELDQRFAHKHVDAATIADLTGRIGALNGRARSIHLAAHLETTALLHDTQVAAYNRLRGSSAPAPHAAASRHAGCRPGGRHQHTQAPPVPSGKRPIVALTNDMDRMYFGREGASQDHFGYIEPGKQAVFGRSYAAEPDVLVKQLAGDEAIKAADTLRSITRNLHSRSAEAFAEADRLVNLQLAMRRRRE